MRKKGKKDSWLDGGFVPITFEMIKSEAYRELKEKSLKTFILLMMKNKNKHPIERFRYQFPLTYAEAKRNNIPAASFHRAIKKLHQVGFIDITVRGGLRGVSKYPTHYRLSQRWKKYGTPTFIELPDGHATEIQGDYLNE